MTDGLPNIQFLGLTFSRRMNDAGKVDSFLLYDIEKGARPNGMFGIMVSWRRIDYDVGWHPHPDLSFCFGLHGGYVEQRDPRGPREQHRSPYVRRLPSGHRVRTTKRGWRAFRIAFMGVKAERFA